MLYGYITKGFPCELINTFITFHSYFSCVRTFKFYSLSISISTLLSVIWYIVIHYNHHVILSIFRPYAYYIWKFVLLKSSRVTRRFIQLVKAHLRTRLQVYRESLQCNFLLIVLVEMWDIWVVWEPVSILTSKKLFYLLDHFIMQQKHMCIIFIEPLNRSPVCYKN